MSKIKEIPVKKDSKIIHLEFLINDEICLTGCSLNLDSVLGYTAKEFISGNSNLPSIIHPDDSDISDLLFSKIISEKESSTNFRIRNKDGAIKCIKVIYCNKQIKDGLMLKLSLQLATTLKSNIEESTVMTNFSAMMDVTDDFIFFKDKNHVFTGASQTLVSVTDPSEHWSDLIGLTDYDVFPEEYADVYYKLEKQIFNGEVEIAHEVQPTLDNEGNNGWVDNRKYPIKDKLGNIIGLFGIARVVTDLINSSEALKLSQHRFATLVGSVPVGVYETDENGNCIYVNEKWLELAGLSFDDALGEGWLKSIHIEDKEMVRKKWNDHINHKAPWDLEYRFCTPSGKISWIVGTTQPLLDKNGNLTGYLGANIDITERKKNEIRLLKLKQSAEKANNAKSEFLSNMSHELRTPMHGILSFAQFGMNKFDTSSKEKLKQYFSNIELSGKRLLALLNNLLDLSKMEAGKMILDIKKSNLNSVFENCLSEQEQLQKDENVIIEMDKETEQVVGNFDSLRIGQVMTNLLSNAIKFSPKGGIIRVMIKYLEDGSLHFCIQDEGNGIPEDELKTIFDAFIQSRKVSSVNSGTGLGLAICKEIINEHNGKIWAQSALTGGAAFCFELPRIPT